MIYKSDVTNIKDEICEKVGQRIIIKRTLGKSKTKSLEQEAVITKTYPNIFVVQYNEQEMNASYKYTDILTRELEVSVFDGIGYCPLIPPLQKVNK